MVCLESESKSLTEAKTIKNVKAYAHLVYEGSVKRLKTAFKGVRYRQSSITMVRLNADLNCLFTYIAANIQPTTGIQTAVLVHPVFPTNGTAPSFNFGLNKENKRSSKL